MCRCDIRFFLISAYIFLFIFRVPIFFFFINLQRQFEERRKGPEGPTHFSQKKYFKNWRNYNPDIILTDLQNLNFYAPIAAGTDLVGNHKIFGQLTQFFKNSTKFFKKISETFSKISLKARRNLQIFFKNFTQSIYKTFFKNVLIEICVHLVFCRKFHSKQFFLKAFFDIIGIFCSVEP